MKEKKLISELNIKIQNNDHVIHFTTKIKKKMFKLVR